MKRLRQFLDLKRGPLAASIIVAALMGNMLLLIHYFGYSQMRDHDAWVNYTQRNIGYVMEFSTSLQEAIVAQHSYLSLGRQEYRTIAVKKLQALPEKLQPVLDNIHTSESQNNLAEIKYETEALLKMSERFIRSREIGDLVRAYDPKLSESFFTLARHIQQNLNLVQVTEKRLLDARVKKARHRQTYYISMMLLSSLLSLAVVVVVSVLMLRLRIRQEMVEGELQEARERLDLAIKGTQDGVWDWNLKTDRLYLSPRLKELYGYADHELPNTPETMDMLVESEDLTHMKESMRRYLAREIPRYEGVFRARHEDGRALWIMSRGAAQWNMLGKPTRVVGVHTDITNLKQLEEELREAKARADSANRAKSSFLANMSHEIRTPMNAIIGIASILAKRTAPDAKEREFVDALNIASNSLFALINDLLDLSKLDEGSLKLEHVPFESRTLFEEVAKLAQVRAAEKKIALEVDIAPNLPQQLIGDPHRLRQIVTNLLSNAVKFTEKGSVTLKVMTTPIGHIEIHVKDTGIGIPKDMHHRIFEKFTQSDPSIARRFGGTGLGLSITKELTELMGGDIELVSSEGSGTEFIVTLPLPAAPSDTATEDARPDTIGTLQQEPKRGMILVVEDYKPNVLVVRTILGGLGFGCHVASSGREAVDALCATTHENYRAVLMDVQLPDMSGVDATRRVREYEKMHELSRVPIIAMTAHALMGDREKFLQAGMDSYIAKPFDPEDLAEKLIALTGGPALPKTPRKRPAKADKTGEKSATKKPNAA